MSQSLVLGWRRGTERLTLSNLDRATDEDHLVLLKGATGLGMAPVSVTTDPIVGGHGSLTRNVRLTERDITVPVLINTEDENDVHAARERLEQFLSPLRDGLNLTVSRAGRPAREIGVTLTKGLEGDYGDAWHGTWQKILLEFTAPEPLWRGAAERFEKSVAPGEKPFISDTIAFFPIILGSSTVQGRMLFSVQGDAPTAPVWTVTGPGRDLLIREVATGKKFQIDGAITEPITIDMVNGDVTSKTYQKGELWARTSADSQPIPLHPGISEWDVSMIGASPDSRIDVYYEPRWLVGI